MVTAAVTTAGVKEAWPRYDDPLDSLADEHRAVTVTDNVSRLRSEPQAGT